MMVCMKGAGPSSPQRYPELNPVKLDVRNIGFEDDQFEVVLCNHVLEHVREDEQAMREIFRVLKPGGFAVLQVPLALDLSETLEDPSLVEPRDRKSAYGQKDHLGLYGLDYFERLERAGFRVVRDNPLHNNWPPDRGRHCLDEAEEVIIGYKD
jgi:SAM-dependent methyltransferase